MFQHGAKALLTWTSKRVEKAKIAEANLPTDRPTSVLHHVRQLTSRCKLLVLKNLKISTNRRKKFTDQQAEGRWVGRKASPGQTTLPLSLACMVLSTPLNKIRFQCRGKLFPTIEKPQHCACAEKMKNLAAVSSKLANLATTKEIWHATDRKRKRLQQRNKITGIFNFAHGKQRKLKQLSYGRLEPKRRFDRAAPKQLNASWNRLNDSTQCEECHQAANSSCKARRLIGGLRVFRPEHTAFYNQMAQMIVPFQIVHSLLHFILACSGGKPTAAHVSSRPFIFLDHLDERRRSSSTSCWWCSPPAEHPSTNYNTDDLCCC
ncbi:hypothetical protein T05_15697 [Trichinella murrelli]|uniref:Uncharacterized protein n=1 Tax=Trichinella murrelli TaxID=144512 RepID=A0A0V0UEA9_9BILA|nr:hypothetical protein T05_15697 [Trichinella murrelli]